eukprot:TRINITY_DN14878_c0_g3_i1.p1 TRINITY_DN14878_c0_g3~~TRINITY_DN14878_c0_g3_i1.p1  ORF type:complete len:725 (-),score=103.87 TRINITY_DN14878_c0_g3_i1:151-2325(-)
MATVKKITVSIDPGHLSKELAKLFRDESRREPYLNFKCGEVRCCQCILVASLNGELTEAVSVLEKASPACVTFLFRFMYGEEIEMKDEGQLLELFMLAKAVKIDSCSDACRAAVGAGHDKFPLMLKMSNVARKYQREALQKLFSEDRLTDLVMRASKASVDASSSDTVTEGSASRADAVVQFVDRRVHRVVIAAASEYFAAMWSHSFVDGSPSGSLVEGDADREVLRQLIKLLYGGSVELTLSELISLYVLADKWQVLGVCTPVLAQIETHIKRDFALDLLKSSAALPHPIIHAALGTVVEQPTNPLRALESGQRVCVNRRMSLPGRTLEPGMLGEIVSADSRRASIRFASDVGVIAMDRNSFNVGDVWALGFDKELADVMSTNPTLFLQIVAGNVAGISTAIKESVIEGTLNSDTLKVIVSGSSWLGLGAEEVAGSFSAMLNVAAIRGQQEQLRHGVVQWAKADTAAAVEALTRFKIVCQALKKFDTSRASFKDLSLKLFESYGDDALPAVEVVLSGAHEASGATEEKKIDLGNENEVSIVESPSERKRKHTDANVDEAAFLDASACWAKPRFKRLRSSAGWTTAQPAALAAVLQELLGANGHLANHGDTKTEVEAAVNTWAEAASLQSLLEALEHLGTSANPSVFQQLVSSAKGKASTLEQHNKSLKGDGLREALAAQRKAEAKAAEAEEEAARQIRWNNEFKAKVGVLLAEPRPQTVNADA